MPARNGQDDITINTHLVVSGSLTSWIHEKEAESVGSFQDPISPGPDAIIIPAICVSDDEVDLFSHITPILNVDSVTSVELHETANETVSASTNLLNSTPLFSNKGSEMVISTHTSTSATSKNEAVPLLAVQGAESPPFGLDAEVIPTIHISDAATLQGDEPSNELSLHPTTTVGALNIEIPFIQTLNATGQNKPEPGLLSPVMDNPRRRRTSSTVSQDGSHTSESASDSRSVKSPSPHHSSTDDINHLATSVPNIKITHHGWIVDSDTDRTISKLPTTIKITCSVAYKQSLVFGTVTGRLFVVHFPPALLTSQDTRVNLKRKREILDNDTH